MLVLRRKTGEIEDRMFSDITEYFHPGELIALNNTKVFPARLFGKKENADVEVEVLLTKEIKKNLWEVLMKPARKFELGEKIIFSDDLIGFVTGKNEKGRRYITFEPFKKDDLMDIVERIGHVPLPPYIKRDDDEDMEPDRERYQTVFARKRGSVAAPTAALHFDREMMKKLRENKVELCEITLNVGTGTFTPVNTTNVEDFRMDRESYEIARGAARKIERHMYEEKPVTAVGTTVVRALESNYLFGGDGRFRQGKRATDIFIYPGFEFKVVDRLLTNFHLPKSTLIMLVSAFAGMEQVKKAYQHAITERYRFYSYGDCMLII